MTNINKNAIIFSSVQSSYYYNFLITGANFGNKGAQSMLFVTVDELRKRFPKCNIYFASKEKYPEELYTFRRIYNSGLYLKIAQEGFTFFTAKLFVKDIIKRIIGRKDLNYAKFSQLARCLKTLHAIIDVSGFALGSKWGNRIPSWFIDKILLARKYKVPMYLMPQSFGPFDYSQDIMQELTRILSDVMKYPRIIFAREQEGFDMLTGLFSLDNVKLTSDLVLQNKGIDAKNIFTIPQAVSVPAINSDSDLTAGIVPNKRCLDHGDKDKILAVYREIINYILARNYRVILFRHSREDLEFCRLIKNFYQSDKRVIVIENELSCLEYNEFVKKFKFLVCSRYHGLVHAYKNIVPCIALGWAVKYRELAKNLDQGKYIFDITDSSIQAGGIINALSDLLANYDENCRIIAQRLANIQRDNCFDILEEDLRRLYE